MQNRQCNGRVQLIATTYDASLRAANESTNRRVMWFSVAEAAVLIAMGVIQVVYLRSFFERKRAY